MAHEPTDKRLVGLTKMFNSVIHGHREMKSTQDGNRFLEALCAQQDASKCVENLIAAPKGLAATAQAFRFIGTTGTGSAFLNGPATSTIRYLSTDSINQLHDGNLLHRIIEKIVHPPIFWNRLVEAHQARKLTHDGTWAFAWLLVEVLQCRSKEIPDIRSVAEQVTEDKSLVNHPFLEVRVLGHKVKHILASTCSGPTENGPGGRHDNDFADFRKIKIFPTPGEFESTKRPFYRRSNAIESLDAEQRGLVHLDNQFRLLLEDLISALRSDYQVAIGATRGPRNSVIHGLKFCGIDCGATDRRKPCSAQFRCTQDIPQMWSITNEAARKKYVFENKNFLKHQTLGCLLSNGVIVAFASVERDEDKLAQMLPILVDTAVFAYEPNLERLQDMTEMPLGEQLLHHSSKSPEALSQIRPIKIVDDVFNKWGSNLKDIVGTSRSIQLDEAQAEALLNGLEKHVSIIQGPSGTGKSFLGTLIAKILHDHTNETILVLTRTNHALDQYLGNLQNIGIPPTSMTRLGKSPYTRALSITEQSTACESSPQTLQPLDQLKLESEDYRDALTRRINNFGVSETTTQDLLNYLEFSENSQFFDAFQVSSTNSTGIGQRGTATTNDYLLDRWLDGKDAGIFRRDTEAGFSHIWAMDHKSRQACSADWKKETVDEQVSELGNLARNYNERLARIKQLQRGNKAHSLTQKRIIGCTTVGAAMHSEEIKNASPSVVIVEEASEILESHILSAMTSSTKQLVLIGGSEPASPKDQ